MSFKLTNLSGSPVQDTQELADLLKEASSGSTKIAAMHRRQFNKLFRYLTEQGIIDEESGECVAILPISDEERKKIEKAITFLSMMPIVSNDTLEFAGIQELSELCEMLRCLFGEVYRERIAANILAYQARRNSMKKKLN